MTLSTFLAAALGSAALAFTGLSLSDGSADTPLWRNVAAKASTSKSYQVRFALCGQGKRITCVVDGDTFWLRGEKIRIEDIDAPEISKPGCRSEYQLGIKATWRLIELLNTGPFEVRISGSRDTDIYGRSLRVVVRDGQSLGAQLVSEGLARRWTGRRMSWCNKRR